MNFPTDDLASFTAADNALVLASVGSSAERELLNSWLEEQRRDNPGVQLTMLQLPDDDPPPVQLARLADQLDGNDGRSVVPVRVFWAPDGNSNLSKMAGLLAGHDPYRPNERRQRKILRTHPSRAQVVAGAPATVAELRRQWRDTTIAGSPLDFARFVTRRAALALERVEYRLLGPEYKSPRLVKPEMLASARFRAGLEKIPGASVEKAGKILDEMATGWSRLSVDLLPAWYRQVLKRGFDPAIDYDEQEIEVMRATMESHPAVLLFSHRSNLDGVVLPVALQSHKLPQAHTFGGVNMAMPVLGSILRRSGIIFIRRNIGDDPLYKYVLKEYVGYVAEKRFNLMWAIEGTRSRTGKMLPPKLGLMSYVADAYLDGRSDDIRLQPVSISFDQLGEIAEYAEYARGAEKKPENLGWAVKFIKSQGDRNFGKIYVRFPESVSMRQYLGSATRSDGDRRGRQTPCAAEDGDRGGLADPAVHPDQCQRPGGGAAAGHPRGGVDARPDPPHPAGRAGLPGAQEDADDRQRAAAAFGRGRPRHPGHAVGRRSGHPGRRRLGTGVAHRPRTRTRGGVLPQLGGSRLPGDLHRRARPGTRGARRRRPGRRVLGAGDAAARSAQVRLLLRRLHRVPRTHRLRDGVATRVGKAGCAVPATSMSCCLPKRPLLSYVMLRPFFEAYEILADVLSRAAAQIGEKELAALAMGVGRQYLAQGRVRSSESVSTLLFATASKVATDKHLLEPGSDLDRRRKAFHRELLSILDDIDDVESIANEQFKAREPTSRNTFRRPSPPQ